MMHARCIHDVTMMHQLHNMYKCNAYFTMPAQCQHDALPNLEKLSKLLQLYIMLFHNAYVMSTPCQHDVHQRKYSI